MIQDFIVLAAGKGQRMMGPLPKVLLPLAGKAMAQHIIDTVAELKRSRLIVVVGDQAAEVKKNLSCTKNYKVGNPKKPTRNRPCSKGCIKWHQERISCNHLVRGRASGPNKYTKKTYKSCLK